MGRVMGKTACADKSVLPKAAGVTLAKLVEYVDGSIVSRTIAESQGGTITLFAFDEGQSLSEHTVPFDAVVQIVDGEAELTIRTGTGNITIK